MQNNRLKDIAKQFHFGIIFYWIYHFPKGFILKILIRDPINRLIDHREKLSMEVATYQLKPIDFEDINLPLEIYFLSGRRFWYQTCFCAYSLAKQSKRNVSPLIYDDGTLSEEHQHEIQRIFSQAKFFNQEEIEEQLDKYLPIYKFPYLRERRLNYPNLRKLTDIHVGSYGWKLVLDSDMLFFRKPDFLLNWIGSPQKPCYMVDVETSYGYSEALMRKLTQQVIPERLNVGICGLKSEGIDWEKLEYWCQCLIEEEGPHYYQEQALIAMLLAGQETSVAPAVDYVVRPTQEEVMEPIATLHHYVSTSKPWYFRYGWKHMLY